MNTRPLLFGALMLAASVVGYARAEEKQSGYVQIAELDIDPTQLESYEAAAKEQIETAIRVEPRTLKNTKARLRRWLDPEPRANESYYSRGQVIVRANCS